MFLPLILSLCLTMHMAVTTAAKRITVTTEPAIAPICPVTYTHTFYIATITVASQCSSLDFQV